MDIMRVLAQAASTDPSIGLLSGQKTNLLTYHYVSIYHTSCHAQPFPIYTYTTHPGLVVHTTTTTSSTSSSLWQSVTMVMAGLETWSWIC